MDVWCFILAFFEAQRSHKYTFGVLWAILCERRILGRRSDPRRSGLGSGGLGWSDAAAAGTRKHFFTRRAQQSFVSHSNH